MMLHDIEQFNDLLQRRRREIMQRLRELETHWNELGDREIEQEEEAQKADISLLYGQLDEQEHEELEAINLALIKIDEGRYGMCEKCHRSISSKRLLVLPATKLCRSCAEKEESTRRAFSP